METKILSTTCCIVGGGPAGVMVGFLLARAGIEVIVLEKYADFFRDFRGDTIHPSTMQIMHELGLLDQFLALPRQECKYLMANYNNMEFAIADFSHLSVIKPVLGVMPQWDFLNFIARQAAKYKTFRLIMEAEVEELLWEKNTVKGVRANAPDGVFEVRANLVIGTDGRRSTVRELAKLKVITTGVPVDMLWFSLSKKEADRSQTGGAFFNGSFMIFMGGGEYMILIDRDEFWQCGYVIGKDDFGKIKEQGLEVFKKELMQLCPFLAGRVDELKSWNDIKLLSVTVDHLEKWYCNGLLCIGDAAHAMSPIGGIGINLAIQDAVAAANILYSYLEGQKTMNGQLLKLVQQRRALPTWATQKLQAAIHWGIAHSRAEKNKADTTLPWPFRLVKSFPLLRRVPAYLGGVGIRTEHVKTPDVLKNQINV